ncbi:MAG TPA: class I adenylate-forming enzyme family protein [Candidatus Acidoferrales bacterium]|nr:class I adenylate-forming enzyme family protein [Candidatus Acidoferrales bacterium]
MLDLDKYSSLGEALSAALDRWPDETCLIEADRDRENARLTYRQFKQAALPLASALQRAGLAEGTRVAVLMTNQSKWLIAAYAIFFCGGILVPLDYKLSADEQLKLLAHSRAEFLIIEYPIWRSITKSPAFGSIATRLVLVTEAPAGAELWGAQRWEDFLDVREPQFVPRRREDAACIVYSSGTGGRPKGCVLTHGNYLEQCKALTTWYPFWPGVRYLSILPTNHAIDFMVGFIGPFVCGACVVHLRTLRPEFVREAFVRYRITYVTLVPAIIKNLERGLRDKFDALSSWKRSMLHAMTAVNKRLTRKRANLKLSRMLLPAVHKAFGGELLALITGGAFIEPATLQFFYDLGIPVANGYGLTEACTVLTVNDLKPFRANTVGKPLPGVQLRILNPDPEGIGEVAARSDTIMSKYLDEPEMTAETIVDGWLITGDLGRIDANGHLQLFGRKKNMIVTEEGKNIYPEDIESAFDRVPVKEFCVFAANYLWPAHSMVGEQLVVVLRLNQGQPLTDEIVEKLSECNRRLVNYKRVHGYLVWDRDFPRTASMKIKRGELAEQIRAGARRDSVTPL